MSFIRSFFFAFSMFSRLPVPNLKWSDSNMRYMLVMFPFVGISVGLFIWAWLWISQTLCFGTLIRAAGLTLLPIAVTGGIHLDGFCDTTDALASRAPMERKREILKDPHTGAFAVISVVAYIILYFAIATELRITSTTPILLGLTYVLCRALSGLSVLLFSGNASKGLLSTFRESAEKTTSVILLVAFFLAAAAGLLLTHLLTGVVMIVAALLCFIYLNMVSRRQFGGMSGDLAGYFLQICELVMLAAIVLVDKVVS